jgi:serine/threonine protein phosphatase PrpC
MTSVLDSLQFGPHFDVAARTCASADPKLRLENQDNYLLIDGSGCAVYREDQQEQSRQLHGWPAGHMRIAVLDGMGGHGHGRQATEAVVAGLMAIPACDSLGELSMHLDALHTDLQHHFSAGASREDKRPGTTLTMLELRPGQAPLLYHVGDSRLYEITPDKLRPLTVDHVPATTFAMSGLLDEREWWQQVHGEHRSQISQAFILGNAFSDSNMLNDPLFELNAVNLPPFLFELGDRRALELRKGCTYLLATDGFWACADPYDWVGRWPELLAGTSCSARAALDALFDEIMIAPPRGLHTDNLTAIALRPRH